MRKLILTVCLMFLVGGCASVPIAPPKLDDQAKKFKPEPGRAAVYIVREDLGGGQALFQVFLDGVKIGGLAYQTYHRLDVDPGEHYLVVETPENQDAKQFEAAANELVFFEVLPRMGWMGPRAKLEQVNATYGMEIVMESELAQQLRK